MSFHAIVSTSEAFTSEPPAYQHTFLLAHVHASILDVDERRFSGNRHSSLTLAGMDTRALTLRFVATFPLALIMIGCQKQDTPTGNSQSSPSQSFDPNAVKIMPPTSGQRFTPTNSALVSFDTQTGSLCMTYQWAPSYEGHGMTTCDRLADLPPVK